MSLGFAAHNFDADGFAIRHDIRLFDANRYGEHAWVGQALLADSVGERFYKFKVAALTEDLCVADDAAIIEDIADALAAAVIGVDDIELEANDDALFIAQFDFEDTDARQNFQIAHEDAARRPLVVGDDWSGVGH